MRLRRARVPGRLIAAALLLAALYPAAAAADGLCPTVTLVNMGDKSVQIGWTLGENEGEIPDFGGYRVWVREVWAEAEFSLAREYRWGEEDTTYWPFEPYYIDSTRVYTNLRLQNAFPYEFSVSAFRASNPDSVDVACRTANNTGVVYPRQGVTGTLATIQVIPNPYRGSAAWENGTDRRVAFVGLPGKATIRIYTVAADLVKTLYHDDPNDDEQFWDLKNSDGQEVAPGVYLWAVDAGELGTAQGKMLIIK
jgi:hypothetical protein